MADPVSYGNPDRDIEQALIALKKGAQLSKHSRKGKPKFCPFRVSTDETTLIWYSGEKERTLKLSTISRIIPGQRTAVFRRHLNAEKDYLSFSLIYNHGERSLDLVCKDKVETEVWFTGLKALISPAQHSRRTRSAIPDFQDGGDFLQNGRPSGASVELSSSLPHSLNTSSTDPNLNLTSSDVGSDHANMQLRTSAGDGFRTSISSAPSVSSHGSGPDDFDSLGDVYVWGEVWCDGSLSDGSGNSFPLKTDVLLPKPLETNVVLDVNQIACGVRHTALVTRQGEVFTWGEESGGRLGHGIDVHFSRPHLVEFLAANSVDYVACGEYHTCAISVSGDLFTWGDGTHSAGLLGHTMDVSHWIPKRISGPLEGLQVLSVACGTWHSALTTSNGKLFTFGDGAFGALGHGNRESVAYPREVEALSGLKTIKVACGVWHTAAIVEVTGQPGTNISSKKLFSWGDGDKNRLGHEDKEMRLVPTCISSLFDYNFQQIACGHDITVALTTSGHVFTMGSPAHGQLGNPLSDGKLPRLVQDRLVGQFVEEISCGMFHVAVLTARSEVFTWGRGANGRLGHGDVEDRKGPTLVEALKDKHVKSISCGSNFTASICIHKWVSGSDQSNCSGCRQGFNITRKRHNCYNCGLVHCHACSSKKALRAALAPTPSKPHRVCDSCYAKLKASEAGTSSTYYKKNVKPRPSIDSREKFDRGDVRSSKILLSPSTEPVKNFGINSVKQGVKSDSIIRGSQVPSILQMKDIALNALKPAITSPPQLPTTLPRPVSPYLRRPSPPRSATPVLSTSVIDNLQKNIKLLKEEVKKLKNQVGSMTEKCELKDLELKKAQKEAQESSSLAEEKTYKCTVAQEVMKSITAQLKDMIEKIPPEVYDIENVKGIHIQIESFLKTNESHIIDCPETNHQNFLDKPLLVSESSAKIGHQKMDDSVDATRVTNLLQNGESNRPPVSDTEESVSHQSIENGSRSPRISTKRNEGEREVIEQFEPGVYVTLVQRQDGTKVFERVRFSKRKFSEQQAGDWWKENSNRVLQKYRKGTDDAPTESPMSAPPVAEEDAPPSSQT